MTHDENFNLTGFNGLTASYNAINQLMSATNNGNSVQFVYDGLGRCVQRTINGAATRIVYDEWNPIVEFDGGGNQKAWNIYGAKADEILARWVNGIGNSWFHSDPQGNVFTVLDDSGWMVEKYTYDAFGKPEITDWSGWRGNVRATTAVGNRFMFNGRG